MGNQVSQVIVHPPATSPILVLQAEFRVAAMSVLAYHYLSTLGAELRFIFRQRRQKRYPIAFILFMLVRYLSLADLIVGMILYYSGVANTRDSCAVWIYFVRYIRVAANASSAMLLAWRAWIIASRSRVMGYFLGVLYVATIGIPIWSESYVSLFIAADRYCWAANPVDIYGLVYYIVNLGFDMTMTFIATRALWINAVQSGVLHAFSASLMREGLWYFLVCAASNVANIIFWSLPPSTGAQALGANMGVAINSIMCQGIVLHLQEVTIPRENGSASIASRPTALRNQRTPSGSRLPFPAASLAGSHLHSAKSLATPTTGTQFDAEMSTPGVQVDVEAQTYSDQEEMMHLGEKRDPGYNDFQWAH